MQHFSPKVTVTTGVVALSFFFLARVTGWVGAFFWIAVILAISFFALYGAPRVGERERTRYTITIPFFTAITGFLLLFVLVEKVALRSVIAALALFVMFAVLHTLYRSGLPEELRARQLLPPLRMTLYAGVFGWFAASFGVAVMLQIPLWILSAPLVLVAGLASWSLLRLAGLDASRAYPATLALAFLTFEFFWVITFLPVGYAVQGWLLGGALYVMVQAIMLTAHTTERLEKRSRVRLLAAIVTIIIVALLARWV
ncbi:hypothetical protein A3H75_03275 [Candidatus Uhrbacteria bacterium RIFCSPLOWO2_02_FULL_51_9]|uniref:Uncharacterized protein n=1 Tax=Candidatus Uhrbacteria bacterium RIFCSPLOWO2_02_FULL_51_9 TaxID=1802410 RepID=A0A1F7VD34_9BACT|nr:MAG: hypothetical protein A3H75_03275 [Candidatus Uhrbacteria bacterium RIFCSPLOWO2_02_FULL_51_9]